MKPCPRVDIERVRGCPMAPPSNDARWAARKELYRATRNRESTVLPWREREAGVASTGGVA